MNSSVAKPLATVILGSARGAEQSIRILFHIIPFYNDAFKLKCCADRLNPQPRAAVRDPVSTAEISYELNSNQFKPHSRRGDLSLGFL